MLDPVQFAWDQDIILPESFDLLSEVAMIIRDHNRSGLSCSSKATATAMAATPITWTFRSGGQNSVLRFLLAHGVDSSRLQAQGFGRNRPIAPNTTVEGAGVESARRIYYPKGWPQVPRLRLHHCRGGEPSRAAWGRSR